MKIDIAEVNGPIVQEMYQVGTVVSTGNELFLILKTKVGFSIPNLETRHLTDGSFCGSELSQLITNMATPNDESVDVNIVRA